MEKAQSEPLARWPAPQDFRLEGRVRSRHNPGLARAPRAPKAPKALRKEQTAYPFAGLALLGKTPTETGRLGPQDRVIPRHVKAVAALHWEENGSDQF